MIRSHRARPNSRGFSLIEVLIAVVVLATGLLALAALQGSLTRSSAEAKTRSRVAAMLTARMDELRGIGYTNAALDPGTTTFNCNAGVPAWLCTARDQANLGSLTVTQNTQIWSSTAGGATFTNAAPADPVNDPQFKRVTLAAAWRAADEDPASPPSHSLAMTSEFSALALRSALLPTSDPNSSSNVSPVVREDDPTEVGMIPIAIGNGSETAATNPKPIIVGRNNTLVETKFNVLTYRPDSGAVRVQQRVETTVIGCRCKYGNQGQLTGIFTQNFRPAYWDGTKYKAPDMLDSSRPAISGPVVLGRNDAPQSDMCTDCCRDHHDASGDTVKFDPFRSGNHDHYLNSNLATPVAANSGGEYSESCRVIRVDGFQRIATDARAEHFDYIGTGSDGADQAPDATFADAYKVFVVDYLKNRFITPSDGLSPETRYLQTPLKKPAQVSIAANNTDKRYLHAHAVLVDHIETGAQQKIDSVLAGCTKVNKVDCILPYIPFTTINMTELAAYSPSNPAVINVVTGGANFSDSSIIQGLVTGKTTATNGQTAMANGTLKMSNTALAGVLPIDPDDQTLRPTAQQQFVVGTTAPPVGASFTVHLALSTPPMSDGAPSNDPGVQWKVGAATGVCTPTTGGASPDPFACGTSSPLGVAASAVVSSYNYKTTDLPTVTCNGNGNKSATSVTPTPRPVCNLYNVTAANAVTGGAALNWSVTGNLGKYGEQTTVNFGTIAPNDTVNITFTSAGTRSATQASCTLSNGSAPYVITSVTWTDPCQ